MRRHRYLEPFINNICFNAGKMAFVSGPRQCGKTTMAKLLLKERDGGFYYNWDETKFRHQWTKDVFGAILYQQNKATSSYSIYHGSKGFADIEHYLHAVGTINNNSELAVETHCMLTGNSSKHAGHRYHSNSFHTSSDSRYHFFKGSNLVTTTVHEQYAQAPQNIMALVGTFLAAALQQCATVLSLMALALSPATTSAAITTTDTTLTGRRLTS